MGKVIVLRTLFKEMWFKEIGISVKISQKRIAFNHIRNAKISKRGSKASDEQNDASSSKKIIKFPWANSNTGEGITLEPVI